MVIKNILRECRTQFQLLKFQEKWRSCNQKNFSVAGNIFPMDVVEVGEKTYGTLNVHYYKQDAERLMIGKYCSIADNVHIFLGGEHDYKTITTYPFKNRVSRNAIAEAITKGPVIIEDDVWVGFGSTILSGSRIGKGAIIGAGSVVSGYVPPYAIYVGNQVVKYRFSETVISKLISFDLGSIDWKKLDGNYEDLYQHITDENVDEVLSNLKKGLGRNGFDK